MNETNDIAETLRSIYRAANNGDPTAIASVLDQSAYRMSWKLQGECAEKAHVAFNRLRCALNLEIVGRYIAELRAVWATGDREAFKTLCCAKPEWLINHTTMSELWARAMTVCYRDRRDYVIAEAERSIPNYIDSLERDMEREAESWNMLARIEFKALYLYDHPVAA